MRIGELSERTGATPRMLRYYEEHGLLTPKRTEGRFREYDDSDVDVVARIRCLLSSALPIEIVRKVILCTGEGAELPGEGECRPLIDVLNDELAKLNARIDQLATSRRSLESLVADLSCVLKD
ncbi:MerR family transcriptional regulator [Herbihabitans rhizosphaerae]|uniref:MerR family transcriptional regulator n=1 Tax=Herbihabitans rhizosphaerae TaxID=1872711 RepID=A0A4Q7L707_9PSEU|nr:MerR family transcriptional regulator [Herbihabitans rhizosphaerae]RZS45114.1 MerR family transcriptional regulator [Herbihabitans rhizosphaerae]